MNLMKIINSLKRRIKLLEFDQYELDLIKKNNFKKFNQEKKSIFFQCVNDHFFLHLYSQIIKKENQNDLNYIGILEIPITLRVYDIVLIIPYLAKKIQQKLLKKKWEKLYKSIGISKFLTPRTNKLATFYLALKVSLNSIVNKTPINKLKINNILVGDLLIDTIIRFRKAKLPTLNVKSFNYFIYAYKAVSYIKFYDITAKNEKITKAFISQSVFIFHGIPLRQFFKNKIEVYSSASLETLFKRILKPNDNGIPYASNYKKIFSSKFSNKERNEGLNSLKSRFSGNDDLGWFKTFGKHPYEKNQNKIEKKIDGVIFLHDFYDGPHYYGDTLFIDFYQWTIHTLDLIEKYNLKIGIKPHPFQSAKSKEVCSYLKKMYSSLYWMENISNKEIFKQKIKFGITQHGTIISELAYHKIKPIYCANHPTEYFKIGFKANSIEQYDHFILNPQKLKLDENLMSELGEYYYMHHIYNKSDYSLECSDGFSIRGIENRFNYNTKDLSLI